MFNQKLTHALLLFFLATTILIGKSFAQNSQPSASSANKPNIGEVSKISEAALIRGCAIAVERIKAGDAYIPNLEKLNNTQAKTIAAQADKIEILQQSISLKEKESQALREALALKDSALAEYKSLLDLSKKEVDHQKKVGNRKFKIGFVGGFVAGLSLKFLF